MSDSDVPTEREPGHPVVDIHISFLRDLTKGESSCLVRCHVSFTISTFYFLLGS